MYKKVKLLLRELGVNMKYKGYYYLISGVDIALSEGEGEIHITKSIYPKIAVRNDVKPYNVEQNIRTAVIRAWSYNKALVEEMCGEKLDIAPSNTDFIGAMALYIRNH